MRDGDERLNWYGVRTIVQYDPGEYDERVTLWRAASLDHAIELGEAEADEHAELTEGENLGLTQAYGPIDDGPVAGAEVFSLIRRSTLGAAEYLARYFATGAEVQQLAEDDE